MAVRFRITKEGYPIINFSIQGVSKIGNWGKLNSRFLGQFPQYFT